MKEDALSIERMEGITTMEHQSRDGLRPADTVITAIESIADSLPDSEDLRDATRRLTKSRDYPQSAISEFVRAVAEQIARMGLGARDQHLLAEAMDELLALACRAGRDSNHMRYRDTLLALSRTVQNRAAALTAEQASAPQGPGTAERPAAEPHVTPAAARASSKDGSMSTQPSQLGSAARLFSQAEAAAGAANTHGALGPHTDDESVEVTVATPLVALYPVTLDNHKVPGAGAHQTTTDDAILNDVLTRMLVVYNSDVPEGWVMTCRGASFREQITVLRLKDPYNRAGNIEVSDNDHVCYIAIKCLCDPLCRGVIDSATWMNLTKDLLRHTSSDFEKYLLFILDKEAGGAERRRRYTALNDLQHLLIYYAHLCESAVTRAPELLESTNMTLLEVIRKLHGATWADVQGQKPLIRFVQKKVSQLRDIESTLGAAPVTYPTQR